MANYLMPVAKRQFRHPTTDAAAAGCKVYSYYTGTTTLAETYTVADGTTLHANPIVLDSSGKPASPVWLNGAITYDFVIKDAADVQLWREDAVPGLPPDAATANGFATVETVADMTATAKEDLADGDVYAVSGYNTANDGGGGFFRWIEGDITTADEGGSGRFFRLFSGDILSSWYGIIADGATDQTTELTDALTALDGRSWRGTFRIVDETAYDTDTVFEAVPSGVTVEAVDSINWGQPPSYTNKFNIRYTGDTVSDDAQWIVGSGHHPAIALYNRGTAGSTAAGGRYASILHIVGKDTNSDPMLGWLQQFAKAPASSAWRWSLRLQTPYAVVNADPEEWVTATVYAASAYCLSDGGKVYKTTAGGTSGGVAPTGTGTGINDGGVLWDYVQSAINIDSTRMDLDENGNAGIYGPTAAKLTLSGGAKSARIEMDDATDDIAFVDVSRGLDVFRSSTTKGFQVGTAPSLPFATMSGATPTCPSTGCAYVNNGGATTMTSMTPPNSQTEALCTMLFANGNTTVQHGTGSNNFILKGAVNVTPATNGVMVFVRHSAHSSAWIEFSRSF